MSVDTDLLFKKLTWEILNLKFVTVSFELYSELYSAATQKYDFKNVEWN